MEDRIRSYLIKLNPSILDLRKSIIIESIKRLGLGESNLNYRISINQKDFIIRINMDPRIPEKSLRECKALKTVEPLAIAPKVYLYESDTEKLGGTFIIIDFIEGRDLTELKRDDVPIKKLALFVAKFHNNEISTKIKDEIAKQDGDIQTYFTYIEKMHKYLTEKWKKYGINEKFGKFLQKCTLKLKDKKYLINPEKATLCHCDIAPQNVIIHKNQLKLIDWESLTVMDPAFDVAMLFDSFDLLEREQQLFLKTYLKERTDKNLEQRVENIWPVHIFSIFYWSLMHVYEIKDEEFSLQFTDKQKLKEHIKYAQKMFNKCKKAGIFDKTINWKDFKI